MSAQIRESSRVRHYAPANVRPDGRFRRVVVEILNRAGLRPRTRAGYTAEGLTTAMAPRQVRNRDSRVTIAR